MDFKAAFIPLLCLLLPLACSGVSLPNPDTISSLAKSKFQSFTNQHNLFFADAKERDHRLGVFSANLDKIDALNARKAGGDAVFGVNQFTHLTFEEFKNLVLVPDNVNMSAYVDNSKKPDNRMSRGEKSPVVHSGRSKRASPTNFDWRTYEVVTSVKNQGQCGCCWAFAAAGATETQYALSYGALLDLSEQELVNCETNSFGCNGGYPDKACQYIQTKGIHYESALPYTASQSSCPSSINGGKVQTTGTDSLAGYTEDQMVDYLYNYGPFTNGFGVGDDFQHYVSGIYSSTTCPALNHAMITVGYGVSGSTKYWIIKNQWGTGWGQSGYIQIKRGVNTCSFKTYNLNPWFT